MYSSAPLFPKKKIKFDKFLSELTWKQITIDIIFTLLTNLKKTVALKNYLSVYADTKKCRKNSMM